MTQYQGEHVPRAECFIANIFVALTSVTGFVRETQKRYYLHLFYFESQPCGPQTPHAKQLNFKPIVMAVTVKSGPDRRIASEGNMASKLTCYY
ncbi:hypothetical protein EVAR_86099_1 [Eumeta japonica]|uniref:Uncharacterized protein n=1 Tax=Eumeta variegata TaxID=151549 RepID=A0A4C1V1V2_EUMVA|nr:hypothetical protein EVAR_86099_1 [Eumeta japonica]